MDLEKRNRKANDTIIHNVILSMGTAIIPVPMADILVLTTLQVRMLKELCDIYDRPYSKHVAQNIIASVAGNSLARLGASLIKTVPGIGTLIGGVSAIVLSGASTYAMGKVFVSNLEQGKNLEEIDINNAKEMYNQALEEGKTIAQELEKNTDVQNLPDSHPTPQTLEPDDKIQVLTLIKELANLHTQGILTTEEFTAKKQELLELI
ncbi:MAG TPA: DUF697 domain-containing protein [Chitinophagales bacterium]|nr:DUF697 domain-containing protein [Chitinophagales bacterium]HRK26973.1 DUF697 domain-containing protein [Chitinophagales bacterium]